MVGRSERVTDRQLTRRVLLAGAAATAVAAAAGCGAAPSASRSSSSAAGSGSAGTPDSSNPTGSSPSTSAAAPGSPRPSASTVPGPPDPASVKANELGLVPVMMYHRLTDVPGEYDMSPTAFRAQVRRLLHSGYRPVDAHDLATGSISVPAGKTPVVLTFDDGSPHQFALRSDGRLDPDCSAGILVAECAKVPGAEPKATFYVNKNPFGLESAAQQHRGLAGLLELGFQLGNHTLDHPNLATLSDEAVAEEFVRLQQLVVRAAPNARLNTMALPFGVAPRPYRLAEQASWHGSSYRFDIVLLVGANPSPSPYAAAFDRHAVPRIRGTSYQGGRTPLTGTYWLDYLDAHPHERYVSAGNPSHVTVPKRLAGKVAHRYRDRVIAY